MQPYDRSSPKTSVTSRDVCFFGLYLPKWDGRPRGKKLPFIMPSLQRALHHNCSTRFFVNPVDIREKHKLAIAKGQGELDVLPL